MAMEDRETQQQNCSAPDPLIQNHLPGINNGDPTPSQSHSNPTYFVYDQLSQPNSNSQNHPFANSVTQNLHIGNPMQETRDLFSARHQNQYQSSGLTPAEPLTWLEDISSSMSRLNLCNPILNPARFNGTYSGSYGLRARFAMDSGSSRLSHQQQQLLTVRDAVNGLSGTYQGLHGFLNRDPSYSDSSTLPLRQFGDDEFPWRNPSRTYTPEFPRSSVDPYRQMTLDELLRMGQLLWTQPGNNFRSMYYVRDKVVLAAKNYHGSRFLQNKIEEGNPEIINLIFWVVKGQLHELMTDNSGSHVIQKLFEAGNAHQINTIVPFIIQNDRRFMKTCIDTNGSRAIQKLLMHLKTREQIVVVAVALHRITALLAKNLNGGYVVQQCLKVFPSEITMHILNVVADNCLDISLNKNGCSVIQKCLGFATGEALLQLIGEIITYAPLLSEDPFGNYVVQYVIKSQMPGINQAMIARLKGSYGQLSKNKHSSNVVEDLLRFSHKNYANIIIEEIMHPRDFLSIAQDPFGNYVVQTAIKCAKEAKQLALTNRILENYSSLQSHLYGKRVLEVAERCSCRV